MEYNKEESRMDIVKFMGGLGNQMFQYAFMEALRHRGRKVFADLRFYDRTDTERPFILDKVFRNVNIEEWKENNSDLSIQFLEKQDSIFEKSVFETSGYIFIGYWQTEKYFKNISEDIRKKFLFTVSNSQIHKFGDRLQKSTFSIHVRRGDYFVNDSRIALYGGICTRDYYQNAMNYIKKHVKEPKFIVFTDDIEWVREQFKGNQDVTIFNQKGFEGYEDWYDMYLMTRCRGNVIANSSFSWWGAWLNQTSGKIVVAPKVWLNNHNTDDIWCDDWILM